MLKSRATRPQPQLLPRFDRARAGEQRHTYLGGQSLRAQEAADRDLVDRRLRATSDHDVGVAVTNETKRVADAVAPSRARSHARVVRTLHNSNSSSRGGVTLETSWQPSSCCLKVESYLQSVLDADVTRRQVDQDARDEEGGHTTVFLCQSTQMGTSRKRMDPPRLGELSPSTYLLDNELPDIHDLLDVADPSADRDALASIPPRATS